ncbi:protein-tyrosine kinase 6-like isoform X2 [Aquarana catesbeiana]|uniref:protein-tyrosine kinase 6-like isoform X2 n=1 Tax=Aquarana catesbeiana TaxID=8400 RepID=UPI003CCA687A
MCLVFTWSEKSLWKSRVRRNKEVLHYIIKKEDTGKVYIFEERSFTCVHDLVHYYRYHLKGHDCLPLIPFLKVPCQKEDTWEKPSTDFTLMKKVKSLKAETFEICLWEGKWADGDRKVFIQTIPEDFFKSKNFMSGIEIHKMLSHRNVAKLYALCTTQDPIYVVTEFMESGDLQTFLRGKEALNLEEAELMYIAQQVADAMAYLEVKRVRHLDLAGCNILVGKNLHCKITQFGLSVQKQGKQPVQDKGKVPIRWMPPEVLKYSKFSDKTDVWSFGIVLYEIFTLGQLPYKGLPFKELVTKLVKGYRLPMPPLCTYDIYRLMLECWNEDADKRPSFQKIVESKILDNHKRFGISDKYVSIKDWQATAKDEISIKANERFQVHSMKENHWLVSKVDVTGGDAIRGYVPCDYLVREKSVEKQSWFSDIDDTEAETLLLLGPNGSFLVRPSKDSHYCLSVQKNKVVTHYAIRREDTGRFFIYEERSFTCVHDLVIYYQHHLENHDCLPLTPFIKDPSHMEDTWERPSSDFTLEEKVYYNKVPEMSLWKGKWTEGRRKVLIQTISKEFFERRNLMDGIEIVKKLNHKNIIELYVLCTTNDPVYIVTEFMEKGDLRSFLCGEEGSLLTDPELRHIADQVADGMAYLEVKCVLHLHLMCRSIHVGDNLVCKISQFSFAIQKKGDPVTLLNSTVPVQWMPPEVLQSGEFSDKTDVWSFGIVLYEIFTLGQTPYTTLKGLEEVRRKVTSGYRLPQPPLCSGDIYSLMLRCWHQARKSRPSFQEIVESKIFK